MAGNRTMGRNMARLPEAEGLPVPALSDQLREAHTPNRGSNLPDDKNPDADSTG